MTAELKSKFWSVLIDETHIGCLFLKKKRVVVTQDVKIFDKMESILMCNKSEITIKFDIFDSNIIIDDMSDFELDVIYEHGD